MREICSCPFLVGEPLKSSFLWIADSTKMNGQGQQIRQQCKSRFKKQVATKLLPFTMTLESGFQCPTITWESLERKNIVLPISQTNLDQIAPQKCGMPANEVLFLGSSRPLFTHQNQVTSHLHHNSHPLWKSSKIEIVQMWVKSPKIGYCQKS